jgi:uroporphyrinogen III methyltransferase/synthase
VQLRERLNWFERRPLFGRRVVVTRAPEQAGAFTERLRELGADVLELPALRFEPPTERAPLIEALAGLNGYDWLVFTSANGVTQFFDAFFKAFQDLRDLGGARLAAVGPATAERLRALHLHVDLLPPTYEATAIVKAFKAHESVENLRIALLRAEAGTPELPRELEAAGAIVDDVPVYQTLPAAETGGPAADRLQTEGADWVTFTSGSAVRHFHARFDLPALVGQFPRLRVASIGPETSAVAAELGVPVAAEAQPHTAEGLVQAILHAGAGAEAGRVTRRAGGRRGPRTRSAGSA